MTNRGSTAIFTNLVGVHPKFESNPCSGSREVEKQKKVHAENDDGHRVIANHSLVECD